MGRKMIVDEDKIFDACGMVEEIVKWLISGDCESVPFGIMEKAGQASLLLNRAMKEGELVR